MASTLHGHYLIIATASRDPRNGLWNVFASVNDDIGNETLRSVAQPAMFKSKQEAEKFGIENCRRWIDENR